MLTTPQPTLMPLVARRIQSLRPPCAPRLVQSWFWGAAVRTLDRDLRKGGGSVAGRDPSFCTACLLGQWMVVSLSANALAPAGGSPPPTPTGGGRSYPDKRRGLRLPRLSLAAAQVYAHKLRRSPHSSATNVSIVSPTRTR